MRELDIKRKKDKSSGFSVTMIKSELSSYAVNSIMYFENLMKSQTELCEGLPWKLRCTS